MANIKSQKKRIITNEKSRMRNRMVKSELKTATRRVKDAVAEKDGAAAYAEACKACRLLDKAVSKGVIKKNQAANRKSGIMKLANTVATDADRAAYEKPVAKAPAKTRAKAMAAATKEKDKRRAAHQKVEAAALKKKEEAAKKAAEEEAAAAAAEAAATEAEEPAEEPSSEAQAEAAE